MYFDVCNNNFYKNWIDMVSYTQSVSELNNVPQMVTHYKISHSDFVHKGLISDSVSLAQLDMEQQFTEIVACTQKKCFLQRPS